MKENKEEVQSTNCIYSYACNTYLEKNNIRRTSNKLQARLFLYLCNGFAKANYIFD